MSRAVRRGIFYGGLLAVLVLGGGYMKCMPGASASADTLARAPGCEALASDLEAHVSALAGEIGERRVGLRDSLSRARGYLEKQLEACAEQGRGELSFESIADGKAKNVIFELPGTQADVVVVGAHYDSAIGTSGANDNASGVAATLALAQRMASGEFERTLRFVLFANEEPPFFHTERMGSLHHAAGCRERGENVVAMLSLESLGYYSDREGSQRYPWPVEWFYPSQGNFVGFVANLQSRALVREAIAHFRRTSLFPSEGAAPPSALPGVGWSDHWAFWQYDYPAIMVTDTAVFRDPNYHRPTDHPRNIDYLGLARVTLGLEKVVAGLARRK